MVGQRIGCMRLSTLDQNEKRHLQGQVLDRVFTDRLPAGDTARPRLAELLRFACGGDTVVVHSKDRLARNLDDLHALVHYLLTCHGEQQRDRNSFEDVLLLIPSNRTVSS